MPCYNEAARLDPEAFRACCDAIDGVSFLFVDDGSTDETLRVLEDLCATRPEAMRFLALTENRGKAEAVRSGVVDAARSEPSLVGYWDADLATPLDELSSFIEVLDDRPEVVVVLGSRVKLLGRDVRRKAVRHYVGRVFATVTSIALRLPVYDTQCGAKVFRCRPDVLEAFAEPFRSRWIFDVEILARLIAGQRRSGGPGLVHAAYELPLRTWHDVEGSKVGPGAYVTAGRDLVRIYLGEIARR